MKFKKIYSSFQSYSKNIRLILLWNMIFCFGVGIHLVLYNLYLQGMVQDEAIIGKILGLNFLAQAIIYVPAGIFSDRLGTKKGVLVGVGLFIIALVGNLFAISPTELFFWGFIIGLGHAASIVTFVPLLTEYSNTKEKNELFSFAFSTGTLFTFLGTLLGGMISDSIQHFFQLTQTSSIQMTLWITIFMFIFCTIPLFFIKESRQQTQNDKNPKSLIELIKHEPKSLIPLAKFSLSKVFAGVSLGIIAPFLNLFFMHKFALSPANISIVLAVGTLATVIFMSYNSRITNMFSEVRTISLYHVLAIPAVIFLGWTQNIWLAIFAFIIFRAAKFGLTPIESKLMMERVNPEIRGLTNSFGFMAQSLCISILGPLAMYIVQIAGYEKGYFFLCLISAFASLVAAVYFHFAFDTRKNSVSTKLESKLA